MPAAGGYAPCPPAPRPRSPVWSRHRARCPAPRPGSPRPTVAGRSCCPLRPSGWPVESVFPQYPPDRCPATVELTGDLLLAHPALDPEPDDPGHDPFRHVDRGHDGTSAVRSSGIGVIMISRIV